MRVRVATGLDEQQVLDVLRADGDASGRQPSKARLAEVRGVLRSPSALTLVADDSGTVVGALLAELASPRRRGADGRGPAPPGRLQLSLLCVAPDSRRRGTGTALVRALLVRFGHVVAWAPDGRGRVLLEREGFAATGRTREARGGVEGGLEVELVHLPERG